MDLPYRGDGVSLAGCERGSRGEFLGDCGASVCLVSGCYLCGAGVGGVGRGALHGSQRRKKVERSEGGKEREGMNIHWHQTGPGKGLIEKR